MRLSLGSKFALTVLVILAATMVANTLYFIRTSAQFQEDQLIERGRTLGRLISLVSPEAILGYDYLLLNDYTREVAVQRDVVYLCAAIYAVFRLNVLSPIKKLIAASREVARGEYPVVEVKTKDEFGLLA